MAFSWTDIFNGESGFSIRNKLNSLGSYMESSRSYNTLFEAGVVKEGLNYLLLPDTDVECTLAAGFPYVRIELDIDCTTRRPKIVTPSGVTINGQSENLILTGPQQSVYVLISDQTGLNYILVAQGNSPFEFEGAAAPGTVTTLSVYNGGAYFDFSGTYPDTLAFNQVSSSGSGTGLTGTCVMTDNSPIEVTSVASITDGGSNYAVGDLITIEIPAFSGAVLTSAVLQVDSIS